MNGVVCANSPSRTRSLPSVNTNRLWFGIFTTLCTVARVPIWCRSAASGVSCRASRCATTRIVFSSPSDWISWIELSRPTVSGSTAWGNSTVSRTGNTGTGRPAVDGFVDSSAPLVALGLITLTKSLAIGLSLSDFISDFLNLMRHPQEGRNPARQPPRTKPWMLSIPLPHIDRKSLSLLTASSPPPN